MKSANEIDGNYNGMRYIVKFFEDGHRCGYVCIDDEKKFNELKRSFDEHYTTDIICHGGITFVEELIGDDYLPDGKWIGFDCAHCGDGRDYENAIKVFGETDYIKRMRVFNYHFDKDGKVWKKEHVEMVCKDIIDKLKK